MSMDALAQRLLARPTLPVDLQQRIFDDAVADDGQQGLKTLEALAGYPDLHPDVDARFVSITSARVLRVWLDREGRDMALVDTLAKSERRKTVLAVIAGKAGLSEPAYAAIADREQEQASAELVANPAVPPHIRERAMTTVVTALESSYYGSQPRDHLGRAMKALDADLASVVLGLTRGKPRTLEYLSHVVLHAADVTRFLDIVVPRSRELARVLHKRAEATRGKRSRAPMSGPDARELHDHGEMLQRIALACDLPDGAMDRMLAIAAVIEEALAAGGTYSRVDTARRALQEVADLGERREQLVDGARNGTSDQVHEALQLAQKTKIASLQLQLRVAVLHNPAATVAQFEQACQMGNGYDVAAEARTAAIASGDLDKQVAAINSSLGGFTVDDLPDPVTVSLAQARNGQPHRARMFIEWLLANGHARDLPVRVLIDATVVDVDGLYEHLVEPLLAPVAATPEAWSTLTSLLDEFEGSVGELVDTALALCPAVDPTAGEPEADAAPESDDTSVPDGEPRHSQLALL